MQRDNYKIFRKIAMKLLGGECKNCGSDYRLIIHHKGYDKDYSIIFPSYIERLNNTHRDSIEIGY